jgi:DNA-binding transcriptional regulator YiaG
MIPEIPHLKVERVRHGVRQYQLAAALGVPQTTVCDWESGRRSMTPEQERRALDTVRMLAAAQQPEVKVRIQREITDARAE